MEVRTYISRGDSKGWAVADSGVPWRAVAYLDERCGPSTRKIKTIVSDVDTLGVTISVGVAPVRGGVRRGGAVAWRGDVTCA